MILLIGSSNDDHSIRVSKELAMHGIQAELVDLSDFPQRCTLALEYERSLPRSFHLRRADGAEISFADCTAIWWRRPQPFSLHTTVTTESHRIFSLNECHEAFAGLWQCAEVFWVNHPTRDEVAHRKAFQLKIAQDVALSIPETLITNDPTCAKAFIEHLGCDRTVYKSFGATEEQWRETRILRRKELDLLDNVSYAPVIFQRYVDAVYDLRVTVVGDSIFPAAIYSQESAYKVDFRMDLENTRIEPVHLPSEIARKLHQLMARLGLVYGAIDMRVTPDGRYVFLEINPAGQWLFVEERTAQPITSCLARTLSMKERGGGGAA